MGPHEFNENINDFAHNRPFYNKTNASLAGKRSQLKIKINLLLIHSSPDFSPCVFDVCRVEKRIFSANTDQCFLLKSPISRFI
jgi:hypothetical protein